MTVAAKIEATPGSSAAESALLRRLLGLSWVHLLNDGSANYLPGILPALLVSLHEPVAMAGMLMAALILVQSLQPVSGYLADRLGGRTLIVAGLMGSALGGALLGFAHDLWVVVLLLAVVGTGNTLFHPQALSAVREVSGARKGVSMSIFLIGGEIGRGIWPSVASFLVVSLGLPFLWLTALPALLTLPLVPRWAPSLPVRHRAGTRVIWRGKRKALAALVAFGSLRSLSLYGVLTFVPILWHLRGGNLVAGASIVTTLLVVGIIGNFAGGHMADRFGNRRPLVVTSLCAAALIALLPIAAGYWLWVIAGLLGVALFSAMPITVLLGQSIFPENRAMGSGLAMGMANAIGSTTLFALGLLAARLGIATMLHALAVVALLAGLAALALPRERPAH